MTGIEFNSTPDSPKVGDIITIRQPVRIPLKWWQRPFSRWIKPKYEERDVRYTVIK